MYFLDENRREKNAGILDQNPKTVVSDWKA